MRLNTPKLPRPILVRVYDVPQNIVANRIIRFALLLVIYLSLHYKLSIKPLRVYLIPLVKARRISYPPPFPSLLIKNLPQNLSEGGFK
jgi:hypothetical protein